MDHWHLLRDVRLRALDDSPGALWAYGPEQDWARPEWTHLFHGAKWLVAESEDGVVGVLRSVPDDERSRSRRLESIWVDPGHRQRGICSSMLRKIIELEAAEDVLYLWLWVIADNDMAIKVYRHLGFERTEEDPKPLPLDQEGHELRLRLRIADRLST